MPDYDGYPTEEELEYIRNFNTAENDWNELMEYIQGIWTYGESAFYKDNFRWIVHTLGWSGNEEIIGSMMNNTIFWIMYWEESRRGGHYKFSKIHDEIKEEDND